jgi:hypothetical protein
MADDYTHERETLTIAASETLWCLKSAWYHATAPLRCVPLCRIGWHDWCRCCSPVNCTRCEKQGHD